MGYQSTCRQRVPPRIVPGAPNARCNALQDRPGGLAHVCAPVRDCTRPLEAQPASIFC